MPSFMLGFLTIIIFAVIGFGAGFLVACTYYLIRTRPVKKYQFTDTADRKAAIKRQVPLDDEMKTGVDGGTALSGFKRR